MGVIECLNTTFILGCVHKGIWWCSLRLSNAPLVFLSFTDRDYLTYVGSVNFGDNHGHLQKVEGFGIR